MKLSISTTRSLITIVAFFCITLKAYAQKQANHWYFGNLSAIDFSSGVPQPVKGSQLYTDEGTSAISDKNGDLLFYTNGNTIWNKNNLKMPNGTGLTGTRSATQAALIVPVPGPSNLYYVFTITEYGGSLSYSIVDINKDGGLGDVIVRNVLLIKNSTEKITAVHHRNNKDIWVIGHSMDTNDFYSWLITDHGISASPIVQSVGKVHGDKLLTNDSLNARGPIKASPDGSKLALSVTVPDNFVEVFDLDNNSGVISAPRTITGFRAKGIYGIEFSPNGKILYLNEVQDDYFDEQCKLYQVPSPFVAGNISRRGVSFDSVWGGALQLAPDGKIYQATGFSTLNVINFPDSLGIACSFQENGYLIRYGSSSLGLPGFVQSYFREHLTVDAIGNCTSDLTHLTATTDVDVIDSIVWDLGDKTAMAVDRSGKLSIDHQYQKPGTYLVKAELYTQGLIYRSSFKIDIALGPTVKLGNDTLLYYGQRLVLNATNANGTYQWSTGGTDPIDTVTSPGVYSVNVSNSNGCSKADTIEVKYDQLINVGIGKDTTFCAGSSVVLDVTLSGATYLWSTGSRFSSISVDRPGTYWVEITNAYKTRVKRDSIQVRQYTFHDIELPLDTTICMGIPFSLSASGSRPGEKYKWYTDKFLETGQTGGTFLSPGIVHDTTFYVNLNKGICVSEFHRINIHPVRTKAIVNTKKIEINKGAAVNLSASGGRSYYWTPIRYLSNPFIPDPVSTPDEDITYRVTVYNEMGCSDTASIKIIVRKEIFVPNTFTPNNDGINDHWVLQHIEKFPGNQVLIYNRNGLLVKTARNYSNDWDGKYKGQALPAGSYYYIIMLDSDHKQTGTVTIIR